MENLKQLQLDLTPDTNKAVSQDRVYRALKYQQVYYNNGQEYNKEHNKTYHYMTNDKLEELKEHLTDKQLYKLVQAWTYIKDLNRRIYKDLDKEFRLNYSKEQPHYSELDQKRSIKEQVEVIQQQEEHLDKIAKTYTTNESGEWIPTTELKLVDTEKGDE